MKLCSKCNINKEETDFNKKKDKLQPYCKECQRIKSRAQYEKNKEELKKKIFAARRKRREALQSYMLEKFKSGCVDCGITDPRVLEWDHITEKNYDISYLIGYGYSKKSVDKELENCELVCSNCHRIRTYSRTKTYKSKI